MKEVRPTLDTMGVVESRPVCGLMSSQEMLTCGNVDLKRESLLVAESSNRLSTF